MQEVAALEAEALSWHMMEEKHEKDSDPVTSTVKANSKKAEIMNPPSYFKDNDDPYGRSTRRYVTAFPGGIIPSSQISPSAQSATSSSYMPPDFISDMVCDEELQKRNMILLTNPMYENKEGFHFPVSTKLCPDPMLRSFSNSSENWKQFTISKGPNSSEATRYQDNNKGGYNEQNSSRLTSSNPTDTANAQQSEGGPSNPMGDPPQKARTPIAMLMDPTLRIFVMVLFFFHTANSSVLPLVMQSLALEDPQAGILLSGLCIVIAQACMSYFAKVCGDFSPIWGRKNLFLIGLGSLTLRCFLLAGLVSAELVIEDNDTYNMLRILILSTQLLDAVGAGLVGCLQILVTNDIAGGTGRFSLMLGVTTGAMCLGGTVSGYIGQAMAQDYGYPFAFTALGIMSLVPLVMYAFFMPETLPHYARPNQQTFAKKRRRLAALFKRLADSRRRLVAKANPFLV